MGTCNTLNIAYRMQVQVETKSHMYNRWIKTMMNMLNVNSKFSNIIGLRCSLQSHFIQIGSQFTLYLFNPVNNPGAVFVKKKKTFISNVVWVQFAYACTCTNAVSCIVQHALLIPFIEYTSSHCDA